MNGSQAEAEWQASQQHLHEITTLIADRIGHLAGELRKHGAADIAKLTKLAVGLNLLPRTAHPPVPGPEPETMAVARLARSCFVVILRRFAREGTRVWTEEDLIAATRGLEKDGAFAEALGWKRQEVVAGLTAVPKTLLDQTAFRDERIFLVDDRLLRLKRVEQGISVVASDRAKDNDRWLKV